MMVTDLHYARTCVNINVMNMWMTYRYIYTYIHRYSDFLVGVISVGLASACPN